MKRTVSGYSQEKTSRFYLRYRWNRCISRSIKGPAFVPTKVESFQEFQQVFGGLTEDSYLPYTAQSYLEEAGTATIVRILGSSGYTVETLNLIVSSSAGEKVAAVLHPTTKVLHSDNANSINSLDNSVVVNLDESASKGVIPTPVTSSFTTFKWSGNTCLSSELRTNRFDESNTSN